jgi:hypothetical protein
MNVQPKSRPILITGVPRSGTTWVGRMLDLSPEVGYINEPFNPTHQPGICSCVFRRWYQYVHAGNAGQFEPGLVAMLEFRYHFFRQIRQDPSRAAVEALIRDGWNFWLARRRRARPLIKDPIAVFSSEWLATRFAASVVVLVRHPAAFAASVKRIGWTFPLDDLLAQPKLIEDHLADFTDEMHRLSEGSTDPVEHAALMWRMVYTVLSGFQQTHPEWLFLRQEDLARQPSAGFAHLFEHLSLTYTQEIERTIRWFSSGERELEAAADAHQIRRASEATVQSWRDRLTPQEQQYVRAECEAGWPAASMEMTTGSP